MVQVRGEWALQVSCPSGCYDDNREITSAIGALAGNLRGGSRRPIPMNCSRSEYLYSNYRPGCSVHWFITSLEPDALDAMTHAVRLVNERWLTR